MKIKTLFVAAMAMISLSLGAQDRIYKKNGLIIFADVKSVSDSAIVFADEQGQRSVHPQTVSAIKYSMGNVLPVSGSIARQYRDEALVYHPFASSRKLNAFFDAFSATVHLGYEQFLDKSYHQSVYATVGMGVGNNRIIPGYSNLGQVKFTAGAGYKRYTSILRDVRFYYGAMLQVSAVRSSYYSPYFSNNESDRQLRNKTMVGIGPQAGVQIMMTDNFGLNLSAAPLFIFENPVYPGSDVSMQSTIGFTYYLEK